MHTPMPILAESNDRPGCLPGTKEEPFFPTIKNAISLGSSDSYKSVSSNHTSSFANKNNDDNTSPSNTNDDDSLGPMKPETKLYSSAPASESSTPFKLPSIDRSKSNSVTSLASERCGHKLSRGRSRDRRSKLCRSPSCPSILGYWHDDADGDGALTPETSRVSNAQTPSGRYVRPFFTHREDSNNIKLPNIFQHRNSINASFSLASTANSSSHTSRDTSPFSFKREPTFLSLARKDLSPDGSTAKLSPRHESDDLQRSGTQSSALLLPISTTSESKNGSKGKRKRKKINGMLVGDGHSETEKLLREKLGAIEHRDCSGVSPVREGEKTDLSDTNVIDKVSVETNLANGEKNMSNKGARDGKMTEGLTTKPPIYQNTPTRIKTEKKTATVKA